MSLSMYTISIPVLIRQLDNLSVLLDKGARHAEAKKFDPAVLVNARLAPDMFALGRQVQIATDNAKGAAARLAGVEIPKYEDTETSFDELQARIAKTIAFLRSIRPEQLEGSEERAVMVKTRAAELHFKGRDYLLNFALPNVFFHVTTTYAILRHNGVEIGKTDYLGGF
ncbi:DUF1993 domain-containing protein [Chitinimonas koreensis]|uniref:DUF1993 domain-containing protein n=1 Tax=Chitinimonas koreensis TaxID=356302 RepID=UPI000414CCA4|nr:DUF1993 domain-containing protein [Chitinimonas koreensis]QNM95914.1 DUF1993 domain-containing protein [Chitinimonas koreensis]